MKHCAPYYFVQLYSKKNGTRGSLQGIKNFEQSKFEPSRVTSIYTLPYEKIIHIHKPNVVQEKVGWFQLHHDTTSNHGLLTLASWYHQNCNHIFSDSSRMIHSCGSRNSSNVWYLKEINPWWDLQYFYPFLNSIICSQYFRQTCQLSWEIHNYTSSGTCIIWSSEIKWLHFKLNYECGDGGYESLTNFDWLPFL